MVAVCLGQGSIVTTQWLSVSVPSQFHRLSMKVCETWRLLSQLGILHFTLAPLGLAAPIFPLYSR